MLMIIKTEKEVQMGQWGKPAYYNKVLYTPHVSTNCGEPIQGEYLIDMILPDSNENPLPVEIKDAFTGKPYSDWVEATKRGTLDIIGDIETPKSSLIDKKLKLAYLNGFKDGVRDSNAALKKRFNL